MQDLTRHQGNDQKSYLLKELKPALNLLSERALPEENVESNDERSESVSTSGG